MRIVHVIDQLTFGGLQTVVMDLCTAQRERGHFVELAVRRDISNNPDAAARMAAIGVKISRPFQGLNRHRLMVPHTVIRNLTAYLKQGRFDVVHSHNPFSLHYVAAACLLSGTPSVNTMHATAMIPRMAGWEKLLYYFSALMTNRTISVHRESEAILRGKFPIPAAKLTVVENGIGLDRYWAVPRRKPREMVVFGAVGRMQKVKNHHLLISAFAAVRQAHSNVSLRILGGGPLEDSLRQHAHALGVADSVEFCPFRPDTDAFLADIDVFCLSSNSEGLPMSLLEALAAGLPVVATAVGGVPDVIHKTHSGWLSPPGDVAAFATAMESALAESGRAERGEQARKLVEHYSVARMASDYDRVYQSVLGKIPVR